MVFDKKKKMEELEKKVQEAKKEELRRALSVSEIQMPSKKELEELVPYPS